MLLIPQGMAHAVLAGLPPQNGLYTATVPLYIYALLGTSNQLSLGPFAITSLLLGTTCNRYYSEGTYEYNQIAFTVSMMAGIMSLGLGLFKLGVLARFLSSSVMTGFITASGKKTLSWHKCMLHHMCISLSLSLFLDSFSL